MQFDVYPNPIASRRRIAPFVAIMQSDVAETGRDRIVAFLAPRATIPTVRGRLLPIVEVSGQEFVLLTPSVTGLDASDLKGLVGNLDAYRDRIVEALDGLFLGV